MSTTRPSKGERLPDSPRRRVATQLFSRSSRLRRVARWIITGSLIVIATILGGFLWFADSVASLRCGEFIVSEGRIGRVDDKIAVQVVSPLRRAKTTMAAFDTSHLTPTA